MSKITCKGHLDSREKQNADWKNRNKNVRRSTPDLSKPTDDSLFSFRDSLRKDKAVENLILKTMKESKRKRADKKCKRKDTEKDKDRLYSIAKKKRRLMQENLYPTPPYHQYTHYIPDSMHEELQLKILLYGLYTASDLKTPEEKIGYIQSYRRMTRHMSKPRTDTEITSDAATNGEFVR